MGTGIELRVVEDQELPAAAAAFVEATARSAIAEHGRFAFAVSGGRTPWAMFALLGSMELPWSSIDLYQVDERIAPHGDPDRSLTHLDETLPEEVAIHPMPVEDEDLDAAADRYAAELPGWFDLIHLGLGADGHTASLVPSDPALNVTNRLIALTDPYQGRRRMTFTYPALERAMDVMWLVEGADKASALRRLMARDASIPAARVGVARQVVFADHAAAHDLDV